MKNQGGIEPGRETANETEIANQPEYGPRLKLAKGSKWASKKSDRSLFVFQRVVQIYKKKG